MTSGFAFHEVIVDEKNTPVDYRYIDVNQAFERLTSIPVSRVLGRRVREAVPEMSDEWIRRYGEVALSGIPFAYEYYTTLTGRHFESYVYSPKRGYFAVVFNDVTERKRAEDRLKELNAHLEDLVKERTSQLSAANGELKASNEQLDQALRRLRDTQSQLILSEKMAGLGQLAAGIAHEINTPLGAILSSVRTILLCSERDIPGVLDGYASFDPETKTLFADIYSLCASIFDPHSFDDLIEERARKKELVALLEEEGIHDPPCF
jgi:PAS domain-containing protein